MATTIITKYGSGAPAASDVVRGELAVDTENKRLYTEDSGGSVVELGTNPTTLAVDTDTLVVDAANDRVGIGTNSPSSPLHVNVGTNLNFEVENSSSTLRLSALNDARDANIAMQFASSSFQFITGNVGIGTTSPSFGLSVESDNGSGYAALFRKSSSDPALTIQTTSSITQIQGLNSALSATNNIAMQVSGGNVGIGTASPVSPLTTSIGAGSAGSLNNQIAMTHTGASNSYHIKTIRASANDEPAGLAFVENTTERMRIDSSGNVGIGTSNPNALTHIYGGSSGRTWTPDNADKLALEHSSSVAFDIRTPASEQGIVMFSDADARARGILAYAHSSDFMYFNTAAAERMRIDSSGRLGLSTTPNTNWRNDIADTGVLQFGTEATMFSDAGVTTEIWNNAYVNNSDAFFNISTRGASRYRLYAGKHEWWTAASASAGTNITSEIQTTPKMTLDVSGNLLVGDSSNVAAGSEAVEIRGDAGYIKTGRNTTGTANHHLFYNPNGIVGSITTSGSSTAYNTSSDQRLKENIVDAPSASDDIDAIQVRSFNWKADGSHRKYGMIAQELITVAPDAVTAPEDPEEMMGVDYSKLVPMLIKEVQQLRARVAQLEGAN